MSVFELSDPERSCRSEAEKALRSFWVNAYLGLYLTPAQRERFRNLPPSDLLDLTALIARMKRRGFDPALAREVRRAVLGPGDLDAPVTPRAPAGALFGPACPAPPPPARPDPPAGAGAGQGRGARKGRRRDDPGQRLLPFMTPTLLVPE